MRFGCCANLVATGADKTGVEIVEKIAKMGYDYIELPLAEMMALDDNTFSAIKMRVAASGIRCETCNNFFPASVRLTGPKIDKQQISDYYKAALARAAELGVSVVVFGSAGAKRVPEGFDMEAAFKQVLEITSQAADEAAKYNITIVTEPIRHPDCNIVNTFADGVKISKTVGKGNVKVLVDIYHLVCEKESVDVLKEFGKEYLAHVHFSFPNIPKIDGVVDSAKINTIFENELNDKGWWRTFPSCSEEWDYSGFISAIKSCGYNGRISLEAPVSDFDTQATKALEFLKSVF